MLLKFSYQDFLEDRRFKNSSEKNLLNYRILLGGFINYCIDSKLLNIEDVKPIHITLLGGKNILCIKRTIRNHCEWFV
ncbi:hypothetical protein C4B60_18010 [Jeotgalibacillus proteolyticus]|uniref:Core-binding (CB) domain-containing protein n=1 Tax=Jeotgalibacillus proteolyticus TaxID=2082395 RepID=A0A2S5G892_9BACL|nr:hypothetical protein C4B60_18010 [Jeotgalibacillus proteolyticus]